VSYNTLATCCLTKGGANALCLSSRIFIRLRLPRGLSKLRPVDVVGPDIYNTVTIYKCCPVLARRWDGAGSMPLKLFDLFAEGKWKDPAVLPSARARERLRDRIGGVEKMIKEKIAAERRGR